MNDRYFEARRQARLVEYILMLGIIVASAACVYALVLQPVMGVFKQVTVTHECATKPQAEECREVLRPKP